MPPAQPLTIRALNRALLARQHLLERSSTPALDLVSHLVGMQAQNPQDPYLALWSRIAGFDPLELSDAIADRRAVRMGLLRTTLHLVTARDAVAMWPVVRDVLARAWRSSSFRRDLDGLDLAAVLDAAEERLAAEPLSAARLGVRLAERWPDRPGTSLAYAARFLLPIVQVPPRGLWQQTGQPRWQRLDTWLGLERPVARDAAAAADDLVLRYLAAFGPASVRDIATWSWLTGLREVVDRLRPGLVSLRDEDGRELLDLPDAPRPPEGTPAPPRFLPEFDNLALSHDDRSRIFASEAAGQVSGWVGTFTADGFIAGQWRLDREKERATLVLQPFRRLAPGEQDDLLAEAAGLMAFRAPESSERTIELGLARAPNGDGWSLRTSRPGRAQRDIER